jgi:myo-inositol-1(or 4)-monophosphatase
VGTSEFARTAGVTADAPYTTYLNAMLGAAREAESVIRDGAARRATLVWEAKGPADFVTGVDTGAEEAIRQALLGTFPGARMLGEETFRGETISDGLWFVVDPLDGTTNFLHGVPEYAVSIAALEDGVLVAGVVLNAARGDCFTATRGGGAYLGNEQLHVSPIREPAKALIATGFPYSEKVAELGAYTRQFARIAQRTAGIRRPGAASLDFAALAAGRYDAFWELSLAPWDVAAGMLLIREAGGVVTDLEGNDAMVADGSFVAGNPEMHAWMLEELRAAKVAEVHA